MKPNYYAIIPAEVRYNEKLSPNAKLLYGEITALSNKKGMCWATNKYFADLYNVSEVSISKWVSQLIDQALIRTQTNQDGKREIYIIGVKEKFKGVQRKVKGGVKEKFKPYNNNIHNNNNINNNNTEKSKKVKKDQRKFSDFPEDVQKSFIPICELFDESLRPKTAEQKRAWCNTIDEVNRLDKVSPRKLYLLIQKTLNDSFWVKQFLTVNKLRKKNSDGVKYIDVFMHQFGKDIKNLDI